MAKIETLEVLNEFVTLDLLLWRRYGVEFRGRVEATMGINRELAELGPVLPVGTRVDVELIVAKAPPLVRVLRLWG